MRDFWIDAAERAARTAAQAALTLFIGGVTVMSVSWLELFALAGTAAAVSLLMSVGASGFGRNGTASFTGAVVSNTEHVDQLARASGYVVKPQTPGVGDHRAEN